MELLRTLAALIEPPSPELERLAGLLDLGPLPDAAEHADLFAFQLQPYASVYLGAEGMLGGEARDRIAGFWRALGATPPAEPDHLTVLLSFHAGLVERALAAPDPGARARLEHARHAFLWEHLLSWLPLYLDKLAAIAPPFHRRWGALLADALAEEAEAVGEPRELPLHLRAAPALADPRRDGGEAFLGGLLATAVSGLPLVRADLARAARELGLGLRVAERRYALEALLAQDPAATLRWLAAEAGGRTHRRFRPSCPAIDAFWSARAEATRGLLEELAAEA